MTPAPKHVIVGTAGHIDHGKSTLIEALTGTHPDRLEEEKRRGITIDLGFAFLEDAGVRFGFVDVPGHERFVKNMLAGASGVDVVLLVIAADECIKPQTREHFEITRMLGVKRGVIALTKSDLVNEEQRELARLETAEFVKGSHLDGAAMVNVSAKTGAGLAELKQALREAAKEAAEKDATKYFRLPVDRSFAVKGFGTVVTGTLMAGRVAAGDEVELLPGGERLRVRGLQSGGASVEKAEAGQRTAVNLAGVEHTAVKRGMVLAAPGRFRATRRMDVRLELLRTSPRLKQRAKVHVHIGTSETVGEVRLYGREELGPGESAYAQLRLQEDVVAVRGDRFIARQFSPVTTIGGGAVLDPLARRAAKKDTEREAFLQAMEQGARGEVLKGMAARTVLGATMEEIVARTGWQEAEARAAAEEAAKEPRAVKAVGNEPLVVVTAKRFEEIVEKMSAQVERYHKENPLQAGMPREELRASQGRRVRAETFRRALEELVARKRVETAGELVKKPGVGIRMTAEEEKARARVEEAFAKAGLAAPSEKEVLTQTGIDAMRAGRILQMLLKEQVLVRVSPELILHATALGKLKELLAGYKKQRGERIGVPGFKELTGVTRKYAIPLLEYLDRQRVTRRAGDERVIL